MTTPDALATSAGSAESPPTFDGGLTAGGVQRIAMVINVELAQVVASIDTEAPSASATVPCCYWDTAALRPSELAALELADVTFDPHGLLVSIRRSKTGDPRSSCADVRLVPDTGVIQRTCTACSGDVARTYPRWGSSHYQGDLFAH